MHPIETDFTDRTYRYTLVQRQNDLAIYRQQHKEEARVVRYEVVRVRCQAAHTWPDGRVTPEREAYPGSSLWGRDGFTCFSLAEAASLMAQLQQKQGSMPE